MTDDTTNPLPLPTDPEDQRKFVDVYVKTAIILSNFITKIEKVEKELEPLKTIAVVFSEQLRKAGIKLSDADSTLGSKLSEIKANNEEWKDGSTRLIDSLKALSSKVWILITAIFIAAGLNVFSIVESRTQKEVHINHYHMPENTVWQYDFSSSMLWAVVEGDTLFKKP